MAGLLEKSVNASIAVAMLAFFMPATYAADQIILGVPFDRIGIGYKRGDDIRAILLVTDFPF